MNFMMIQQALTVVDRNIDFAGQVLEWSLRQCKPAPHYQYVLLPIYKSCAARVGTVAATAITFLVGDIFFHQLLGNFLECSFTQFDGCDMSIRWTITLVWCAVALPIMYVKHKKEKRLNKSELI